MNTVIEEEVQSENGYGGNTQQAKTPATLPEQEYYEVTN